MGKKDLSMPKLYRNNKKVFLIAFFALGCSGCGLFGLFGSSQQKNPDEYHVGTHEWVADSIFVKIYSTSQPNVIVSLPSIEAECRSCNLSEPPTQVAFQPDDVGRIYFPEARSLASVRIHLHGHGIDTTFIQKQRSPNEATTYFHLSEPLIGRVFIDQFSLLYLDSSEDSSVTNADIGDELNIYGERSAFYIVHHPNFRRPLYLLKADAVRLY